MCKRAAHFGDREGQESKHDMTRDEEVMDKCTNCGRRLRSKRSRELGYGPVCYGKKFGNIRNAKNKNNNMQAYDQIPGQMTLEDYLGAK